MSANQWYYAVGDQRQGPVEWAQLQQMARGGQLAPHQLVWSEGMADWIAAQTVEGLFDAAIAADGTPQAIPLAYARPIDDKTRKILRNAKQNCIAMFVIFCLSAPLSVLGLANSFTTVHGKSGTGVSWHGVTGGVCCAWPLASLFAAIYLPLRWQHLKQLSSAFRVLGLIGGFGLIAMFALWMLGAVVTRLLA